MKKQFESGAEPSSKRELDAHTATARVPSPELPNKSEEARAPKPEPQPSLGAPPTRVQLELSYAKEAESTTTPTSLSARVARYAKFTAAFFKDFTPVATTVAAAAITYLTFLNTQELARYDEERKRRDDERKQHELMIEAFTNLASDDEVKRTIAGLGLAESADTRALDGWLLMALGADQDKVRSGAVEVVSNVYLARPQERPTLLATLARHLDTARPRQQEGILLCLAQMPLSSTEAKTVTESLSNWLGADGSRSSRYQREVIMVAGRLLGGLSSTESANILIGILRTHTDEGARSQAIQSLRRFAPSLPASTRSNIKRNLIALKSSSTPTLAAELDEAVADIPS